MYSKELFKFPVCRFLGKSTRNTTSAIRSSRRRASIDNFVTLLALIDLFEAVHNDSIMGHSRNSTLAPRFNFTTKMGNSNSSKRQGSQLGLLNASLFWSAHRNLAQINTSFQCAFFLNTFARQTCSTQPVLPSEPTFLQLALSNFAKCTLSQLDFSTRLHAYQSEHDQNGNLHRMRCTFMNLLHSICLAKTVQFLSALTIPIWLFPSWCIGDFLTSRHALQGAASLKGSTVFITHNLIVCGNIAFDDTRGVAYTISMTLQLSNATKTTFISESGISQTSFSEKAPFS